MSYILYSFILLKEKYLTKIAQNPINSLSAKVFISTNAHLNRGSPQKLEFLASLDVALPRYLVLRWGLTLPLLVQVFPCDITLNCCATIMSN